ncbi:hypothetical protein [Lacinutrix sp. 5H-3-7-4]|nr:hypothetical protein [Lacinutrix sp. 5H-3-7-4]AEH01040.1 hypothetical protein Lacal_1192 [Lacinutrix sp. 5H-3-7-4]
MKPHTSLFSLIATFTKAKQTMSKFVTKKEHCQSQQLHDFYCNTITNNK